jgi:hypothetical protein
LTKFITVVLDAVWGWPGVLLAFLLALEAFERTLKRSVSCRTSYKIIVAAAILTVGLFTAWRGLSTAKVDAPNWEEIELRREAAANRRASEESLSARAKRLKADLDKQERERKPVSH